MNKQITLTLETAKEMYNSGIESLRLLTLENFTQEELETFKQLEWERDFGIVGKGWWIGSCGELNYYSGNEAGIDNRNVIPTKELAKAFLALMELTQWKLRINNSYVVNWNNIISKWCIIFIENSPKVTLCHTYNQFLNFQTKEIAELFLKQHEDLINKARPCFS